MRLDELAAVIGAELAGDGAIDVTSVATLEQARPGQITFVSNPKYAKLITTTKASAAVVAPHVQAPGLALLKTRNPYHAFSQVIVTLHGHRNHPHTGIHPKAHVESTATVGEGTIIYPGAYVGPRCRIGRDCILYPGVCLYDDTVIGDRVIVHAGAVLGSDGYGFATEKGVHHKIPQIGNLIVEDDVEIGANCSIARGALSPTIIGHGTKIDSLVMIGHGTTVGPHCFLVAQVGISGSVNVGHHVTLAGQVGVAGHLKVGDESVVYAQSGIISDVKPKSQLFGSPAFDTRKAMRSMMLLQKFPEIVDRIKKLEKLAGIDASAEMSTTDEATEETEQ